MHTSILQSLATIKKIRDKLSKYEKPFLPHYLQYSVLEI